VALVNRASGSHTLCTADGQRLAAGGREPCQIRKRRKSEIGREKSIKEDGTRCLDCGGPTVLAAGAGSHWLLPGRNVDRQGFCGSRCSCRRQHTPGHTHLYAPCSCSSRMTSADDKCTDAPFFGLLTWWTPFPFPLVGVDATAVGDMGCAGCGRFLVSGSGLLGRSI